MGRNSTLVGIPEPKYADTIDSIHRVISALNRAADRGEPVGFDTEFYGVDLRTQSTVARSQGHLISVAVWGAGREIHPRGFTIAHTAVLPWTACDIPAFKAWLERDCPKVIHNLGVDAHTLGNPPYRITLNGGINSLATARFAWPARARSFGDEEGVGFTLDALAVDLLGVGKTESYKQLFQEEVTEVSFKDKRIRVCSCGERNPPIGHPRAVGFLHQKHYEVESVGTPKTVLRPVPLESVTPGHRLWPRALAYSAQDAWLALAVYELALRELERRKVDVPWIT